MWALGGTRRRQVGGLRSQDKNPVANRYKRMKDLHINITKRLKAYVTLVPLMKHLQKCKRTHIKTHTMTIYDYMCSIYIYIYLYTQHTPYSANKLLMGSLQMCVVVANMFSFMSSYDRSQSFCPLRLSKIHLQHVQHAAQTCPYLVSRCKLNKYRPSIFETNLAKSTARRVGCIHSL